MKKILIVLSLVLVGSLSVWWFVNNNESNNLSIGTTIEDGLDSQSLPMTDTRCTFSQNVSGIESLGVVHISGDKIEGKFISEVAVLGATVESNMLHLDGWVYSWSSMSDQGFKSMSSLDLALEKEDLITEAFAVPEGVELEYDCQPWILDQSVFNLPSNINFVEA